MQSQTAIDAEVEELGKQAASIRDEIDYLNIFLENSPQNMQEFNALIPDGVTKYKPSNPLREQQEVRLFELNTRIERKDNNSAQNIEDRDDILDTFRARKLELVDQYDLLLDRLQELSDEIVQRRAKGAPPAPAPPPPPPIPVPVPAVPAPNPVLNQAAANGVKQAATASTSAIFNISIKDPPLNRLIFGIKPETTIKAFKLIVSNRLRRWQAHIPVERIELKLYGDILNDSAGVGASKLRDYQIKGGKEYPLDVREMSDDTIKYMVVVEYDSDV